MGAPRGKLVWRFLIRFIGFAQGLLERYAEFESGASRMFRFKQIDQFRIDLFDDFQTKHPLQFPGEGVHEPR
jgi:hypothetical protein